jgi:hypothetical protein
MDDFVGIELSVQARCVLRKSEKGLEISIVSLGHHIDRTVNKAQRL